LKFLIDNQLPPALARFVQSEFEKSAVHGADIGLRDASDAEVWSYASANNLILISKDEDFANMVLIRPTAKLIWVRIGNCRRVILLESFRRMWPRIVEWLACGEVLAEIRAS
jgi:predicted nuclease of predicted toxin-antitoxin system